MTTRAILMVVMSVGWWRVPAACTGARIPHATLRRAGLVTVTTVAILALSSGPMLDALEVDSETFRIAAGLALVGLGLARLFGWGLGPEEPTELADGWLWPVAYPVLVGPELVLVAVSVGSDHGFVSTTAAAAGGVLLAAGAVSVAVLDRGWRRSLNVIGVRGAGVALTLLAVALVFDGLRDV